MHARWEDKSLRQISECNGVWAGVFADRAWLRLQASSFQAQLYCQAANGGKEAVAPACPAALEDIASAGAPGQASRCLFCSDTSPRYQIRKAEAMCTHLKGSG